MPKPLSEYIPPGQQQRTARAVGVEPRTMRRYLARDMVPAADVALRIAAHLGIDPRDVDWSRHA